jgi:hypothetical protein
VPWGTWEKNMESDAFSEKESAQARQLLEEFGFPVDGGGWSEIQRFKLYDQLSTLAFQLADDAIRRESQGEESESFYHQSNVAQCAMNMVASHGTFDQSMLQELYQAKTA